MNELVACISDDVGKAHVEKLMKAVQWDNVILVKGNDSEVHFGNASVVSVDLKKKSEEVSEELVRQLKKNIKGTQVGVNFFSGNGKLHMATVSALLKLGLGIRLVVITPEGVKEI